MPLKKDILARLTFSKPELAAISFATLLSLACLARGAVYDGVIALLLLLLLPVLYTAMNRGRTVHNQLQNLGILIVISLIGVLVAQYLFPTALSHELWQQTQTIAGTQASASAAYDKSAWVQGLGRILLCTTVFVIALFIGSSESSSRLFLQSLLLTGTVCLTFTFFAATREGVPLTTYHSYSHGFVNPNNAAAYLGIMVLLALSQAIRLLKRPIKSSDRTVLDIIDQLNLGTVIKGSFVLFAILMALTCLLMTASRGGILLTLLSSTLFIAILMFKMNLRSPARKATMAGMIMLMGAILVWNFINFGQVITSKLATDGVSSNSRFEIIDAALPVVRDHFWIGTGLGSFPGVFQRYRPQTISSDGIIDKAHNSYVEFAAEMGIPMAIVLISALAWIGYILYKGVRSRQERYIAPTLGLLVWAFMGLYSLIDFPLQIPGIMALFLAIITVCASQTNPCFSEPPQPSSSTAKRVRIRKRRKSKDII